MKIKLSSALCLAYSFVVCSERDVVQNYIRASRALTHMAARKSTTMEEYNTYLRGIKHETDKELARLNPFELRSASETLLIPSELINKSKQLKTMVSSSSSNEFIDLSSRPEIPQECSDKEIISDLSAICEGQVRQYDMNLENNSKNIENATRLSRLLFAMDYFDVDKSLINNIRFKWLDFEKQLDHLEKEQLINYRREVERWANLALQTFDINCVPKGKFLASPSLSSNLINIAPNRFLGGFKFSVRGMRGREFRFLGILDIKEDKFEILEKKEAIRIERLDENSFFVQFRSEEYLNTWLPAKITLENGKITKRVNFPEFEYFFRKDEDLVLFSNNKILVTTQNGEIKKEIDCRYCTHCKPLQVDNDRYIFNVPYNHDSSSANLHEINILTEKRLPIYVGPREGYSFYNSKITRKILQLSDKHLLLLRDNGLEVFNMETKESQVVNIPEAFPPRFHFVEIIDDTHFAVFGKGVKIVTFSLDADQFVVEKITNVTDQELEFGKLSEDEIFYGILKEQNKLIKVPLRAYILGD